MALVMLVAGQGCLGGGMALVMLVAARVALGVVRFW